MNPDDETRDPHLREALRHAPDAQLQAPPALSALILQEARAKARDPKPAGTTPPGWVRSVWEWLARPAVATGFAGVMAATLVGLMWWDQPMDEALPRAPAPAAAPALQKPAPAEAAAPATLPARPALDTPPTAPRPEPAPEKKKEAKAAAPARTESAARQEAAERDTRGTAAGDATAGAAADVARPAPPAAPVAAAAPPPAPAPAPAPAAPTAAAPGALLADNASAEALAKGRAREEEQKRERSSMAPAEVHSRRAAAKLQLNESRLQRESEAFTRVASVRAAIAAEPTRWTWQRGAGEARPLTEALGAWLAQLDAAAGTRWQARQGRDGAAPTGRELTLLRDGQVQHRWQLTEQGALWDRGQSAWQVELPAEQASALRRALDSAAP